MHNPKNPHVYNYLLNAFNSLTANKKFADIFKNTKLIKSVRQPPNLGRLLQKHNIDTNLIPNGSVKCNKSNCGTCPYLLETDTVIFVMYRQILNYYDHSPVKVRMLFIKYLAMNVKPSILGKLYICNTE